MTSNWTLNMNLKKKILVKPDIKKVIDEHMPETFTTLLLKTKLRELGYWATQQEVSLWCLHLGEEGELHYEVNPDWQQYATEPFNLYTKVHEAEVDLIDYLSDNVINSLMEQGISLEELQSVVVAKTVFPKKPTPYITSSFNF